MCDTTGLLDVSQKARWLKSFCCDVSSTEIYDAHHKPVSEHKPREGGQDSEWTVKSELRMITVEDSHFAMWKEFIEKHHRGELINPDTGDMYKDRAPFTLSSKFQLTREFFKHFGHFTNADFKVYVQHLLGRTPDRMSAYPKVTVHKTALVHASHHTGHEWVERRKRKQVVMEELVELQPDLKFIRADVSVDGDEWRNWKLDHRVSSGTYNILLYLPGSQYFSKRLTNEEKLKRASEF